MINGQWYGKNELIEIMIEITSGGSLYVTIPTDDIILKKPFKYKMADDELCFNIRNFLFYLKQDQYKNILCGIMRSNLKFSTNIEQELILQPLKDKSYLNHIKKTRMEKLIDSNNYKYEDCNDVKLTVGYLSNDSEYYKKIRSKIKMNLLNVDLDFVKALKIMNEVCNRYRHNGRKMIGKKQDFFSLDQFASENDLLLNCRGMAFILEDVLCAYNLHAKSVTCMQYEEESYDCHVCVEVFDPTMNKWIFLDPSYNLYICNLKKEPLGLYEIKRNLINHVSIYPSKNARYLQYNLDFELYIKILIKKLCRFSVENYHINGMEKVFEGNVELVWEDLINHGKQRISNPSYFWRSPYTNIYEWPIRLL